MDHASRPDQSKTPRIFIAATEQNGGKTTTSLGLHQILRPYFPRMGFIKPVGQRFTEFEGKPIDEDSVLIQQTFQTRTPIEAMSPITVHANFTRDHIAGQGNEELVDRLRQAFAQASAEKDFVVIEGTGHAGVGSVFDLSNARVARLLGSQVILVVPGGIGRPVDEIALNRALFDREGVEILGVIMNKVLPARIADMRDVVGRGLRHLGLDLLAVLPAAPILTQPTLHEIRGNIQGTIASGPEGERNRVTSFFIGAMSSSNLLGHFQPGALLIVPGDREDIILAALAEFHAGTAFSGMVLTDNHMPHARILKLVQESRLPVIQSPLDCYAVIKRIQSLTVKTLPGDTAKISTITKLFQEHFDPRILLSKLGLASISPAS